MTNLTNLDLLELSNQSYQGSNSSDQPLQDHPEYQKIDIDLNKVDIEGKKLFSDDFRATAYYDQINNKLIISYAGTDDLSDLFVNDPGYVAGYQIPQFDDAVRFYDEAIKLVEDRFETINKDDILLTGHSHGGGLAQMVGVLNDVEATVFNAPGIGGQLNNIESYYNNDQIKSGQLTSQNPSLFKVTNIYLDSDVVHLAGSQIGTEVAINSSNSVFGAVLYTLFGAAGTALTTGPVGVSYGILTKFIGSGISNNHMISGLKEALENQEKINSGQADKTTTEKFLNAIGSINSYIDKGISSVTDIVNKTVDWLFSGHVTQDLVGVAKDAWNSTVSFFDGLFDGHSGSAPTNSDGTVNANLIDNTQLNLTINTDLTRDFRPSTNPTQTGNAIDGGDYQLVAPIMDLNGDGVKNVAPYSIALDNYRPGNNELSSYVNFNTQLSADFSRLDNLSAGQNSLGNLQMQLQNPLADITNQAIGAQNLLNVDPVVLDLNGDGVTDSGELKTLNEVGIKEFDLSNITQASKERNVGNIIFSKTTYTTTDNQTKQVAAVDFTTNPIWYEFNDINLGELANAEDGTKSLVAFFRLLLLTLTLLFSGIKVSHANGYSYKTGCKYNSISYAECVGSVGYIYITPWQESEKKNKDLTCKLNIFVKSSKKNPEILEPMRNLPKVGSIVRPNSPLIFYQDLEQIKRQYEICDKAITEIDKRVNYKKVGFKSAKESKSCGISGCLSRINEYDANGEEDILGVGNRLEIISYENLKEGLFAKIKVVQ